MDIKWNFPSANKEIIKLHDINVSYNSTIPYKLLVNEICSSCLKECNNNNLPVKVIFKSLKISFKDIPGIKALETVISNCKDYYSQNCNDIGIDFYNEADLICNSSNVNVLRISSYNTKPCNLDRNDLLVSWRNFLEKYKISYKNGAKSLCMSKIFQCSKIRTAFFSSVNNSKLELSQGISTLTSNNLYGVDIKGIGYYGKTNGNLPLYKQIILDKDYTRTEDGLDIYILGTEEKDVYENQFVINILDSFEHSIAKGELEIEVNDIKLNKETLKDNKECNMKNIKKNNLLDVKNITKIHYFIYLINKNKEKLKKDQQKVVEYISNNIFKMVRFYNIDEFSREIGISATTINVALLKIGIGSYKRFYSILCRLIAEA